MLESLSTALDVSQAEVPIAEWADTKEVKNEKEMDFQENEGLVAEGHCIAWHIRVLSLTVFGSLIKV